MNILKISFITLCILFSSQGFAKDSDMPIAILKEINVWRIKHQLKPLALNNHLSQEAKQHSQNMAAHKIAFGHDGYQKRFARCFKALHKKSGAGAENVAYNYKSAEIVVREWLKSPGHLKNIRGDYTLTGIGIARDKKGKIYFTQIFMRV